MLEDLEAIQQDYEQTVVKLLEEKKFDEVKKHYSGKEAQNNPDPVFQLFRNYALAEANLGLPDKAKIADSHNKKAHEAWSKIVDEAPEFADEWDDKIKGQRKQIDAVLGNSAVSSNSHSSSSSHTTRLGSGGMSAPSASQGVVAPQSNLRRKPSFSVVPDNRPRDYEYALLAKHIYNRPVQRDVLPENSNWRVHQIVDGGYFASFGFYGAIYKNTQTRQAVVVFRGTSDGITWLENLYSIVLNNASSVQKLEAFQLVKGAIDYAKDEGYQLSFTGHSLGAFLAELAVFFCHSSFNYPPVNAVSFESPGIREMVEKIDSEHEPILLESLDIISYLSYPNIVNTCNHHVGTLYSVEPTIDKRQFGFFTGNVVQVHSMDNILSLFEGGALKERAYMGSWPLGSQKKVFEQYCTEEAQSDEGNLIKYKLSLSEEAFNQAVIQHNRKQYSLEYEGKYKSDEMLSNFQSMLLRHFSSALGMYLKLFYKQALIYLYSKDGVEHLMQTLTKEQAIPAEIVECLLS